MKKTLSLNIYYFNLRTIRAAKEQNLFFVLWRCPYYRGRDVINSGFSKSNSTVRNIAVSILWWCPHFRGRNFMNSVSLGTTQLSLIWRCPYYGGVRITEVEIL